MSPTSKNNNNVFLSVKQSRYSFESTALGRSASVWWLSAVVAGGNAEAVNDAHVEVRLALRVQGVGHQNLHLCNARRVLAEEDDPARCCTRLARPSNSNSNP